MGFFSSVEPTIVKEGSSAQEQLAVLESLRGTLPPKVEEQLEEDIRNVRAGIAGEKRILFELKNSHLDMFVLQDLFLEHNGLTAQIDFLVITLHRIFVLECKNLYGDIEINGRGDFVRTFGGRKKEGIYSPVTQNQRHLELIHAMKRENRGLVTNLLFDGGFDDLYRGLVVLANPKTVLNDRYAKRDVKDQIVRADQLIDAIRRINGERGFGAEKTFRSVAKQNAEWFLSRHSPPSVDYVAKYRAMAETVGAPSFQSGVSLPQNAGSGQTIRCPRCGAPMVLRTARRGKRAGKQFYGCSNYPNCNGAVNVE